MSRKSEKLAIDGGSPIRTTRFPNVVKHDLDEWQAIKPIFERGSINMTRGPEVMKLREEFRGVFGMQHAVTTSSGTSALHAATAAVGIGRGDEVITSPITDMGTIVAIIQQNAVPVFADVAPGTFMISPETVMEKVTPRTKAVIPIHLGGLPCDVIGMKKALKGKNIAIIEDVAQSYMVKQKGRFAGTIGDIGCWSLNESKHIGAGDGGMLLTNNANLAKQADLFADKCYDRETRVDTPFFSPYNYRLSTLTAAVCLEQLKKLDDICERRNKIGKTLEKLLSDIPGISPLQVDEKDYATYWYYLLALDFSKIDADVETFYEAMRAEGVYAGSMEPYNILRWTFFQNPPDDRHACSFNCPHYDGKVDYSINSFPNMVDGIKRTVRIPINENYDELDVKDIADAVRKVANHFAKK